MARAKKGTPTELNLWVLGRLFGTETRVLNRLEATSVPHVRRCLQAGLLTVEGTSLVLTPEGVTSLGLTR